MLSVSGIVNFKDHNSCKRGYKNFAINLIWAQTKLLKRDKCEDLEFFGQSLKWVFFVPETKAWVDKITEGHYFWQGPMGYPDTKVQIIFRFLSQFEKES